MEKYLIALTKDNIKRWHKRQHYDYQSKIVEAITRGLVKSQRGETIEIPIEMPRQSGKTTAVVDTAENIIAYFRRYFKISPSTGIFAPEREQATTDFDRLKEQFNDIRSLGFTTRLQSKDDIKIPQRWNSKAIKLHTKSGKYLGEVYIFPVSKNSNPESKTLHLIVIEESQDIDDDKVKKSIFPMGASTNALRVYIGTAGTRLCYFKTQLENNPNAIRISLDEVFRDRRKMYELTGDERHLLYERFVNHEIAEHGRDSIYIRTQYFGEWIIGAGQFCTAEQLNALEVDRPIAEKSDNEQDIWVGIDSAKTIDDTVVTVLEDDKDDPRKSHLLGWLELHGDNYEDQFDIIQDYLSNFNNIRGIGIDSTGQGDFMPDKFERHSDWNIRRFKFTPEFKDIGYKNLLQVIQNKLTTVPKVITDISFKKWRQQMLDLEKEKKGRFISVHHPKGNYHDDYADSWMMAEQVKSEMTGNLPNIRVL